MSRAESPGTSRAAPADGPRQVLRLYVSGTTPRSMQAVAAVRALCERHLAGRHDLAVIDLYQQPARLRDERIVAAPVLLRMRPGPVRRITGDLTDAARILAALGVAPAPPDSEERNR